VYWPDRTVKRYTNFPLPERRFIPGWGIHPNRDPRGGHLPELPPSVSPFTLETWHESLPYLYAIDLFNFGYYWEAHVYLEKLWIGVGKKTEMGLFLQGLIQVAAALLKQSCSKKEGARRLAEKGIRNLRNQKRINLGIDTNALIDAISALITEHPSEEVTISLHFPDRLL
jgi:predicted metal-dependent hydrolase